MLSHLQERRKPGRETWLSNVAEASSYDAGSHILDDGFTEF